MFITGSSLIIMPVPPTSLRADPEDANSAKGPVQERPARGRRLPRDSDSGRLERLASLVQHYQEMDPNEAGVAKDNADEIPLDTVSGITLTWVRSSGRSRFLSFFSLYPVEPANAGYHVNYQLAIAAGNRSIVLITPFSPELRQTLRDLLGKRVREIPDEYAPLL